MKPGKLLIALLLFWYTTIFLQAQPGLEQKKFEFDGYISNMQSVMALDTMKNQWISDNLFHNRLNMFWYPTSSITATLQLRNRFQYGQSIQSRNTFGFDELDFDEREAALNLNGTSYWAQFKIDRLWVNYTLGNLEITAGRQRINWGQSFAWNPNDLFNAYSFFDFDYPERPGTDALRLQYYTGMATSVEAAVGIDSANNITAAGLIKLNKWNYDFQFIGGYLSNSDYVAGMGWSGYIRGAGFRGEMSYFHPKKNVNDTTGLFMATISADYTFGNSLYLQGEVLLSTVDENKIQDLMTFYSGPLTVKNLAVSKLSVFAQASYPVNPFISTSLAAMYYNGLKGIYIGTSLTCSLSNNFDASLYYQLFTNEISSKTMKGRRAYYHLAFLRFKYSF